MGEQLASFEVKTLVPLHLFGLDVSLTNSALYMLIVTFIVCLLFFMGTKDRGLVPSKLQAAFEALFFFIGDLVKANLGKSSSALFPYVFALFMFILLGNLVGLFPFAFSFTSQIIVTGSMACIVFITSIVIGFVKNGLKYLKHFLPDGIPLYLAPFFIVIEMVSFLFRPISLGVRLFANMVSGHIMIQVIAGFAVSISSIAALSYFAVIPVAVDVLLNVFKVAVCILQAYVFVVLSCIYLSESLAEEH